MTPLGYAVSLAADLAPLPLPDDVHAQLGEVVIDCPGTYVTVLIVTEIDPSTGGPPQGNCNVIQLATVSIAAARDCSFVANEEDGTTDWTKQNTVSAQMDVDASILWDQADKWRADAFYIAPTPVATNFTQTGGLAIVVMALQLPVP